MEIFHLDLGSMPDGSLWQIANISVVLLFPPCFRKNWPPADQCTEDNSFSVAPNLEYEDGLKFCYFYTGGTQGGNAALKAMLTYMQDSREENATDEATREVHSYVSRAKIMPEVKNAYMTLGGLLYYANMEERRSCN